MASRCATSPVYDSYSGSDYSSYSSDYSYSDYSYSDYSDHDGSSRSMSKFEYFLIGMFIFFMIINGGDKSPRKNKSEGLNIT